MIELFRFVDGERGGLFVMKRAARPIISALAIERDVAADDLHDIILLFQLLHKTGVDSSPASAHTVTPPKENVSGMNRLSNTLIAYLSVMPDR